LLPIVMDGEGRLYLQRYHDHERRLATRLWTALQAHPSTPSAAALAALDAALGAAETAVDTAVDPQRAAVLQALRGRLCVISGGPGTGKTTTVVTLLACLRQQQPDGRLALAAPTGKAAARMGEAIRQRLSAWPESARPNLPTQATTVHRLLGWDPSSGRFRHHARHPLALDALVVDEASMLDLALARRLLDAVPPSARIVLLGDKDQLAAVESGAVFAELCGAAAPTNAGAGAGRSGGAVPPGDEASSPLARLAQAHVHLSRNFRFASGSGIGALARSIQAGRADELLQQLRDASATAVDVAAGGGVHRLDDAAPALEPATLRALHGGWKPYLDALRQDPGDAAAVLRALDCYRLLAAQQSGPRGVRSLNEQVARYVWASLQGQAASPASTPPTWYLGRPVMVLRNDPTLGLFNGDLGVALPASAGDEPSAGFRVWFAQAGGGVRAVAPSRLPEHQTAFAMTVHKSQGSEFDAVAVVLPAEPHPLVSRELLYTAVTRARQQVVVVGSDAVVRAACLAPTRRRSGLLARLADCADACSD
jgi:exodeoxyribonuclease V alpha subunit